MFLSHLRQILHSSRKLALAWLCVGCLLAGLGVPLWSSVHAFALQAEQLQRSMQARFGAEGVQKLKAWITFQAQQVGRPVRDQLKAVNDFWNENALGGEDLQIWGEKEYWATPLETLGKAQADCEDYVIGKYFSLLQAGVPEEKLRFIYVRARQGGVGSNQSIAHMVLGYYETPQSEPLVLDNLLSSIVPASQRSDLTPVFSFNGKGIYVQGAQPASVDRISRWRGLQQRMQQEGFLP